MKLIYVADPMCSWCYGFSKEVARLTVMYPSIPVEIVLGGLSAGSTKLLDDAGKRFRLGHWERVEAVSGLPFNREALMARKGFIYDSEPASRAFVTAVKLNTGANALKIFRAIQKSFYVDGIDVTNSNALVKVLAEAFELEGYAVDTDLILSVFNSEEIKLETQNHFKTAKNIFNVSSFPVLLLEISGEIKIVTSGYVHADMLHQTLNQFLYETKAIELAAL